MTLPPAVPPPWLNVIVMQRPKEQSSFTAHCAHVPPLEPQVWVVSPAWHAPELSQHPVQFAELQAGFETTGEQAVTAETRRKTTTT